jgi:hypothetical protein
MKNFIRMLALTTAFAVPAIASADATPPAASPAPGGVVAKAPRTKKVIAPKVKKVKTPPKPKAGDAPKTP